MYAGKSLPDIDNEKVKEYFDRFKLSNDFTIIEIIDNDEYNDEIALKCNKCGYYFVSTLKNIVINKNKCPRCSINIPDNLDYLSYVNLIHKKFKNEFKIIELNNDNKKIKVKHSICNNEFNIEPEYLLKNGECFYCTFKNNIESYMINMFINIITRYVFNNDTSNLYFRRKSNINFENDRTEIVNIYDMKSDLSITYIDFEEFKYERKGKKYLEFATIDSVGQNFMIFQDEWFNKQNLILKYLNNIINKKYFCDIDENKIIIKEITKKVKNNFINKYAIYDDNRGVLDSLNLGLFYNINEKEILLGILTLSDYCFITDSDHTNYKLEKPKDDIYCDGEINWLLLNQDYYNEKVYYYLFKYLKENYRWQKISFYTDKRFNKDFNIFKWQKDNIFKNDISFGFNRIIKPRKWYFKDNYKSLEYFEESEIIYDAGFDSFILINNDIYK